MAKLGEANIGGRMVPAWLLNLTAEELDGLKWHSNPNLLDNWYFGNPVDQRGGHVVPPGKPYLEGSTQVGTTDKYYTATPFSTWYNITVNGVVYNVASSDVVRGYIGDGYSNYVLDRWRVENNIVVTFESDGVSLENVGDIAGQYNQELPHDFFPEGTLMCISAIVKSASGDARLFLSQSSSPFGHPIEFIPLLQPGLYSGFGNLLSGNHKFSIYLGAGAKIKLAAAKLELGQTQTLAHQDSAGNWVLNEIPDYGEQLRRCQRYFVNFNPYKKAWFAMPPAVASNNIHAYSAVTLPVAMRAQPVVSYGGNIVLSQSADNAVTNILVSDSTFAGNSIQLRYEVSAGTLTANSLYRVQGSLDTSAYIWLSADL